TGVSGMPWMRWMRAPLSWLGTADAAADPVTASSSVAAAPIMMRFIVLSCAGGSRWGLSQGLSPRPRVRGCDDRPAIDRGPAQEVLGAPLHPPEPPGTKTRHG